MFYTILLCSWLICTLKGKNDSLPETLCVEIFWTEY